MRKESEYRKIDRLSYSAIAKYAKNPMEYYKRYILKEEQKQNSSPDILMGRIVDTIKTDVSNFDNEFFVTEAPKPTAQLLRYTELMIEALSKLDNIKEANDYAYNKLKEENGGKLQKTAATFKLNFETDALAYYNEVVQNVGKSAITQEEKERGYAIVSKIDNTKAFLQNGDIFSKFVLLFEYNKIKMKCEIDEFIVDHTKKKLYIYDYKATNFVNDFLWECYLKRYYYIQGGLYQYALKEYAAKEYPGYKVENMAFKVVDIANEKAPLLYKMSDINTQGAFDGFYVGYKYYKGIDELLTEIELATELNLWDTSITNYNNNSVVHIPAFKLKKEND